MKWTTQTGTASRETSTTEYFKIPTLLNQNLQNEYVARQRAPPQVVSVSL